MSLVHVPNEIYDINVQNATLPQAYERAKVALSQCSQVDECKDWADKAHALASYAKQANDETLMKYAKRIQLRAYRRAGELLKQFDGRHGQNLPNSKSIGDNTFSQSQAAKEAGLSKHQKDTSVRVANVDEDKFNKQVDSDDVPTLTAMAEQGKKFLETEKPEGFKQATHFMGALDRMLNSVKGNELLIISGLSEKESTSVRRKIKELDKAMDMIFVNLK